MQIYKQYELINTNFVKFVTVKQKIINIILLSGSLFVTSTFSLIAQDTESPLPPVLTLVTVDPLTGNTTLEWTPGGSPDVAGYVFYDFRDGAGEAFDTVRIHNLSLYTDTRSNAALFSVSYCVAAIDSSDNISPLSNNLSTIFNTPVLDSCQHGIDIEWTPYNDNENPTDYYTIYVSINGTPYSAGGEIDGTIYSFFLSEVESGSHYCFYLEATLADGKKSLSNRACVLAALKKPPQWINGDFAIVKEDHLTISFTYDSQSEISTFRIEESLKPDGPYTPFTTIEITDGEIVLDIAPVPEKETYYRAVAINSCNEGVKWSNQVTLINPLISEQDNLLLIRWNRYLDWIGGIDHYTLYRNYGTGYRDIATITSSDTSFIDNLHAFQHLASSDSICYFIKASEGYNPYYTNAESISKTICINLPEKIYVPTAFTPDGNNINELFRPVLSFTPSTYRLIIRDRRGALVFESRDHLQSWDGAINGTRLHEDVYFWFVEATSPGGTIIKRNGTVTIIHN